MTRWAPARIVEWEEALAGGWCDEDGNVSAQQGGRHPGGMYVVCSLPKGHDGPHLDREDNVYWELVGAPPARLDA